MPGRGESIHAHDAFQLFGTVTTGAGRAGGAPPPSSRADPLAGLWARVAGRAPAGDEPAAVLVGIHPALAPLAPRMLATLNAAQSACGQGGAAAAPGGDAGGGPLEPETSGRRERLLPGDARTPGGRVHAARPAPVGAAAGASARERALLAARGRVDE